MRDNDSTAFSPSNSTAAVIGRPARLSWSATSLSGVPSAISISVVVPSMLNDSVLPFTGAVSDDNSVERARAAVAN